MWLNGVNSLGASGAILGLLGVIAAFGIRYGDRIPKAFRDSFRLDIWFFVLAVALMSLMPAVDWAGHLGGFLAGVLVGVLWPAALLDDSGASPVKWFARGTSGALAAVFVASLAIVGVRIYQTSLWMPAREIRSVVAAIEDGELDRASAAARRLTAQLPDSDGMRYLQVLVLLQAGESDEAFEALESIAGDDPNILPLKVQAAFEVDRPDVAVDTLRQLERLDPRGFDRAADGDNALAWALFLAEPSNAASVDEGLRRVRRALKGSRNNRAYRNTLAYGLVLNNQPERALSVVNDLLVGRSPDEQQEDIFIKVMALADLKRLSEAESTYREFAALFPDGTLREEAAQRLRDRGISIP